MSFISILVTCFILSVGVVLVPKSIKYYYSLFLLIVVAAITTIISYKVFYGNQIPLEWQWDIQIINISFTLTIDNLSAFFILVINLTVLIAFLYARGYLEPYYQTKPPIYFSIHYLAYLWLYFSMILVTSVRDGLSFLIAWELMAVSSFLLVIFDAEDRTVLKTGINYLIQMHAGMFFILIAFLIIFKSTGRMNFEALGPYFSNHSNILLFLLFFIGFGLKAGFIPLHTWLPQAHPAAPSHVSGVMSGVMIKMGIYGILRVLLMVHQDSWLIGIIILAISLISGLLGVMMAIVQHDLKKLLAYHSIENIGIIGIGIGLGMIGLATGNATLSLLGFSGGILHVLNHSLFKSLLFFNAGSVYMATHTRNVESLGGLMKKMPYTAFFFLIGSLAICGLPPFNGFISEYLIYLGMVKTLSTASLFQSIIVLLSLIGLVLIGGLAIFCFTKAFGLVFLGEPRTEKVSKYKEVKKSMILPQFITVFFIVLIGLFSTYFVKPVFSMVSHDFGLQDMRSGYDASIQNLTMISLLAGIFILLVISLLIWRYFHLKKVKMEQGPTWGCGYTNPNSRMQYTATSYADNFIRLSNPLIRVRKAMKEIGEDDIFPESRKFESHSSDVFREYLVNAPVNFVLELMKRLAVMQTGQIQHYILYLFVYILLLFVLTYFNLI